MVLLTKYYTTLSRTIITAPTHHLGGTECFLGVVELDLAVVILVGSYNEVVLVTLVGRCCVYVYLVCMFVFVCACVFLTSMSCEIMRESCVRVCVCGCDYDRVIVVVCVVP